MKRWTASWLRLTRAAPATNRWGPDERSVRLFGQLRYFLLRLPVDAQSTAIFFAPPPSRYPVCCVFLLRLPVDIQPTALL